VAGHLGRRSIKKEGKNTSDASGSHKFIPPSRDEVIAYCKERGNNIDPQQWHDYYTSVGWSVGKNAMKDWKAAVRTWECNGSDWPLSPGDSEAGGTSEWGFF